MDEIQGVGKVERKAYSEYDDRVTRVPTTKKFAVFTVTLGCPRLSLPWKAQSKTNYLLSFSSESPSVSLLR